MRTLSLDRVVGEKVRRDDGGTDEPSRAKGCTMSAVDLIVADLTARRDYLADKLANHRDAFTPAGADYLVEQIAQLETDITLTTGAAS